VQRRVDQADGDGQPVHRPEDADEVVTLVGQELGEGLLARLDGVSARIISRMALMRSPSKNMCSVRVRPMPSAPNSRPAWRRRGCRRWCGRRWCGTCRPSFMTLAKSPESVGSTRATAPAITSPVEPSIEMTSSRPKDLPLDGELPFGGVDVDVARAGDAALAPAARDDGRVAGHAAGAGEDAGGRVHALDVLGAGLLADEDDALAGAARFTASSAVKAGLPTAAPGDAGRPLARILAIDFLVGIEEGSRSWVRSPAGMRRSAVFSSIELLLDHVAGDLDGGGAGALAGAGLEHEERAALDRELDVLHLLVVLLERCLIFRSCWWTFLFQAGISSTGLGVRMPATTSSPWALMRNSP
jgi:hypothetical protein